MEQEKLQGTTQKKELTSKEKRQKAKEERKRLVDKMEPKEANFYRLLSFDIVICAILAAFILLSVAGILDIALMWLNEGANLIAGVAGSGYHENAAKITYPDNVVWYGVLFAALAVLGYVARNRLLKKVTEREQKKKLRKKKSK